jgi:hypothetical protein
MSILEKEYIKNHGIDLYPSESNREIAGRIGGKMENQGLRFPVPLFLTFFNF